MTKVQSLADIIPPFTREETQEMESLGLVPRVPYIRASDYETASQDEFLYFLKRRLGLTKALSYSPALSRGTWFHVFAGEHFVADYTTPAQKLDARKLEIARILRETGGGAATIKSFLDEEDRDFTMARAWWDTCLRVPIKGMGTIEEYFGDPRWHFLGTEMGLRCAVPGLPAGVIAARLDLLALDKKTGLLWIVDHKTCTEDTETRLSTCLWEFQTNHYMTIVGLLCQRPWFRNRYHLPKNTQLGGMIHLAYQKPTIKFCGYDRDFTVDTTKPNAPKKYFGEPRIENYIKRCEEWLMRSAMAGEEAPSVPTVNFSVVDGGLLLDKRRMLRYQADLRWMMELAFRPGNPYLFRSNINNQREFGKLGPYTPFYYTNVWEWPGILKAGNFVIGHRDAEESYVGEHVPDRLSSPKRGNSVFGRKASTALSRQTTQSVKRLVEQRQEIAAAAKKAREEAAAKTADAG